MEGRQRLTSLDRRGKEKKLALPAACELPTYIQDQPGHVTALEKAKVTKESQGECLRANRKGGICQGAGEGSGNREESEVGTKERLIGAVGLEAGVHPVAATEHG